jgi:preprotein translocase subunit SecG
MDFLLSAIIILSSILLILVVYIQNPKGGGLSSEFGSPSQLGGVQKTTEFIDKLTWSLAGAIVVASIIMTLRQPRAAKIKQPTPTEQQQNQGGQPNGQNQNGQGQGQGQ